MFMHYGRSAVVNFVLVHYAFEPFNLSMHTFCIMSSLKRK